MTYREWCQLGAKVLQSSRNCAAAEMQQRRACIVIGPDGRRETARQWQARRRHFGDYPLPRPCDLEVQS